MSLTSLFDTTLSFCEEYGVQPVSVFAYPHDTYPTVSLVVDRPNDVREPLFWETSAASGITVARVTFDGVDVTVQASEKG